MTTGYFFCNKCDITFKGEYKPQQRPRKVCPNCHKTCDLSVKKKDLVGGSTSSPRKGGLVSPSHPNIPPQNTTQEAPQFIDDPDELLLSVAKRELNKPNPDPRWATILINCKKENINTKTEVLEQFRQQPTQLLVNLLNKSLQKEPS